VFVYAAWVKLYGWTLDPHVITACIVHDWGYWGCTNMDGPEGKEHPRIGARIMGELFDEPCVMCQDLREFGLWQDCSHITKWHDFTLYHSRSIAKQNGAEPSKLCAADKLASALMPWWLYVPLTILTGEIKEYMQYGKSAKLGGNIDEQTLHMLRSDRKKTWCLGMQRFMRNWVNSSVEGAKV
jgi:hypothetical protein